MPEPAIDPSVVDLLTKFVSQAKEHAVICMDAAGTITAWLGAAERLLGHTAEEAVGQSIALIFTAEDKARGFDRYERLLADVQSRSEDDRWHVRKDGTRIWVTGALEAVKGDAGELLGYVKVIRDRTDLRTQIERLEN
jgi:PAS domain S-box-containing protein